MRIQPKLWRPSRGPRHCLKDQAWPSRSDIFWYTFLLQLGALDFVGKTLSNTVFIGILVLVLFAVVQNLRGKEADIPSISEAVRMQL